MRSKPGSETVRRLARKLHDTLSGGVEWLTLDNGGEAVTDEILFGGVHQTFR